MSWIFHWLKIRQMIVPFSIQNLKCDGPYLRKVVIILVLVLIVAGALPDGPELPGGVALFHVVQVALLVFEGRVLALEAEIDLLRVVVVVAAQVLDQVVLNLKLAHAPGAGFIFEHLAQNPRFDNVTRRAGYSRGPSGFLPVSTEGMSFFISLLLKKKRDF